MLRKAAKPEPPRHAEDVRLWLGVHDLSRIEWTAAVQIPTAGERRYDVQLAVEVPRFGDKSTIKEAMSPWSDDLRCLLAEGLSEELAHRRGKGYITPHADGHAELAAFLERASRLKKHFQDVLYLDVEAYFVDSRMRNYTGVVAAALAGFMWLSFTLLPIGSITRAGLGV